MPVFSMEQPRYVPSGDRPISGLSTPHSLTRDGRADPYRARVQLTMVLQDRSFVLQEVAWLILDCARRTRPFRGRAFREQEDNQAASLPLVCRVARAQGIALPALP